MRVGVFWEAMVVWAEDRDADRAGLYTLIRNVGHSLFNIQLQRKDKMSPAKYLRLPWDREADDDLATMPEDVKEKSLANLRAARKKANW